jgi:hypothetical protein
MKPDELTPTSITPMNGGKPMPYEALSPEQLFWLTLIYATPGSGKSVLMNRTAAGPQGRRAARSSPAAPPPGPSCRRPSRTGHAAEVPPGSIAPLGDLAALLPFHRTAPIFKQGQSLLVTPVGHHRLAPGHHPAHQVGAPPFQQARILPRLGPGSSPSRARATRTCSGRCASWRMWSTRTARRSSKAAFQQARILPRLGPGRGDHPAFDDRLAVLVDHILPG